MAHFVKLDKNNVVVAGVVVNNSAIDSNNEEISGVAFLHNLYQNSDNWKQTSYNAATNGFRKNYAGIGYFYDAISDVFIPPKPFASWLLNKNFDWEAPTAMPTEGKFYWDENIVNWISID